MLKVNKACIPGGGEALRYGLAIICRTTLGSSGRDSKAEIGGR